MISYLIQASVCLAIFYGFYYFFLAREKLLNLNRFYLLFTAIISLIIPLLNITIVTEHVALVPILSASGSGSLIDLPNQSLPDSHVTPWYLSINPWNLVYTLGLLIAFSKMLFSLVRLLRLIRNSEKIRVNKLTYVVSDATEFSSFLHFIFIPTKPHIDCEANTAIIEHEVVHARHGHSLDLFLMHLLTCFFWFNPIAYWYRWSLKLQHEFIADHLASERFGKDSYTEQLLTHSIQQSGFPLTHSFTEHPVEKRLKMIDNLNPTTMKKLRLTWSLPLMLALILVFSVDHEVYAQTSKKKEGKTHEVRITDSVYGKVIDGKVTESESGKSLEKVSVFFRPSNSGSVTNEEGIYKVVPHKTDTLMVFRKQGYEDTTVPIKNYEVVNVNLTKKATSSKEQQKGQAGQIEPEQEAVQETKQTVAELMEEKTKEWSKSMRAQVSSIRGNLKDAETDLPLENAKIWSLPSGKSTVPDAKGNYLLPSTPKDTLLSFTAKGYKSLNVPRKGFSMVNVVLSKVD